MKKKITLSMLLIVTVTGNIFPVTVSASGENFETTLQESLSNYSLGPDALKKALINTGSNCLVLDLYALTILKQEDIDFKNINSITSSMKNKMVWHQGQAKKNARLWLDTLKDNINTVNQSIINYDSKFQSYYEALSNSIDNTDKTILIKGISKLSEEINKNGMELNILIDNLKAFKERLSQDSQHFHADYESIKTILTNHNNNIPLLSDKIQKYHEDLDKYTKLTVTGIIVSSLGSMAVVGGVIVFITGAGIPVGTGLVAGGTSTALLGFAMLEEYQKKLDKTESDIYKSNYTKNAMECELIKLAELQNKTAYLSDTLNIAIKSLENIANQWDSIGVNYNNLLQEIQHIQPTNLFVIKETLAKAKQDWAEIRQAAINIHNSEIQYK